MEKSGNNQLMHMLTRIKSRWKYAEGELYCHQFELSVVVSTSVTLLMA